MRHVAIPVVMAVVFCAVAEAPAALLSVDPAAMSGWQGTANFFAADGVYTVQVDVEYAVYAPGDYPGTDPSGGTDYVYAYEIFNDVNSLSVGVSILTVGLLANSQAQNIGYDTTAGAPGLPGGVVPSASSINWSALSARWFFLDDTVDYPEDSVTLLFTSPKGPRWMSSSVTDGGLSASQPLPSPVPEPATLALLGAGLGVLACRPRKVK